MCCFGALAPSLEADKTGVGKIGNRQLTKQFLEETNLNNKFTGSLEFNANLLDRKINSEVNIEKAVQERTI